MQVTQEQMGRDRLVAAMGKVVLSALDRMPESQRLPIWLHHCIGFGPEEAAEALSLPEDQLGNLLNDGMQALIGVLKGMDVVVDLATLEMILPLVEIEQVPGAMADEIKALAGVNTAPTSAEPYGRPLCRPPRGRFSARGAVTNSTSMPRVRISGNDRASGIRIKPPGIRLLIGCGMWMFEDLGKTSTS